MILLWQSQYSSISAALLTQPFVENNKPKRNSWTFYFWSTCCCELWFQMWRQNSNCLQISLFYDFQNDAQDNSIPHKSRSRLHSEAQFHIKHSGFRYTSNTALMQPSFSGLFVTWANLPETRSYVCYPVKHKDCIDKVKSQSDTHPRWPSRPAWPIQAHWRWPRWLFPWWWPLE